jgi:hypothetical protein
LSCFSSLLCLDLLLLLLLLLLVWSAILLGLSASESVAGRVENDDAAAARFLFLAGANREKVGNSGKKEVGFKKGFVRVKQF